MKKSRVRLYGFIILALIFIVPKTVKYFLYDKAEGTVIKINEGKFGTLHGNTRFQFPTIRFVVKDSVLFYDKDNEVLFSVPALGDKETVLYNPANHKDAYLNKFGSFWFALPDLMIFILLCIAWVGVINILYTKPRKKKVKV